MSIAGINHMCTILNTPDVAVITTPERKGIFSLVRSLTHGNQHNLKLTWKQKFCLKIAHFYSETKQE